MKWSAQTGESTLDRYLYGLSPSSRRRMAAALRRAAAALGVDYESHPWHELTREQASRVREKLLADGAAPASVNVVLSALRGIARAAHGRDPTTLAWEDEKRLDLVRDVRNVPLRREGAPGRALSDEEFAALLVACARDRTAAGARDAALILSLHRGGLLCRELVALDPDDFAPSHTPTLTVGQGSKRRSVPLDERAADAVAGWLALKGSRPGRMFVPLDTAGAQADDRMTERNVSQVLAKRARSTGLDPVTAEDLRHTAIKNLFEAGLGYPAIRRVVGPVSFDTLARYDGRDQAPSPLSFLPRIPRVG